MLRAAACRWRRHIQATTRSTRSLSSTASAAGAGEGDWNDVGVFWDFENCPVPSSLDPFVVRPNIERALRTAGFLGSIYLSGYGDIHGCRVHCLEALSETGVDLHHVPNGAKNSSDRALMIDLLLWTMKHLPPAHVLLISGDSDFSVLLHKLRLLNYNVLLAAPNNHGIASALVHASSRIWIWPDMATGEGLLGHIHVPGTPSPFHKDDVSRTKVASVNKSNTDLQQEMQHVLEDAKDPREDVMNGFQKLSPAGWIPPQIVNRITRIVEHCPGISLGEISKELKSANVYPRAFGFGNTHQFLMSIPQLSTRFDDGSHFKERARYYLVRTDNSTPGNGSVHLVHEQPVPQDERMSCNIAANNNESSDGVLDNEKPGLRGSTNREAKGLAKKGSPASIVQHSWVPRLFTLFKGG